MTIAMPDRDYQARITGRLIYRIAGRYIRICEQAATQCESMEAIVMDVLGAHECACALDLEGLLKASDTDIAHDVGGILRHYNRKTRKLEDHFTPRYFKRQESAHGQGG